MAKHGHPQIYKRELAINQNSPNIHPVRTKAYMIYIYCTSLVYVQCILLFIGVGSRGAKGPLAP